MSHEPSTDAWVLYEFSDRFLADLERGGARSVEHYLEVFPGRDAELRREYDELVAVHGVRSSEASGPRVVKRVGPYKLLHELGRGGQARVWLAEHLGLGRKVALKVLGSTLIGASTERRERFRREAELVARLEHPGICGVLEADLDALQPWIAMRYVPGETLSALLARERASYEAAGTDPRAHPIRGARLAERLLLLERIARALHAAHEAGVVHRDVKPGNLMTGTDGAPVVLDFGLAYDEEGQSALTRTGEVFGTPAYMAPEQIDGTDVDRRTDVYGMGVVCYEALTLSRPFADASSEALTKAIRSELPGDPLALNPALPRDVAVVLSAALEKEPARRYATALEFAEELRRVREFEPIVARPISVFGHLTRWSRRNPALAAGTLGSILLLSLALVVSLMFIRELRTERNAKEEALGLYEGAWFRDLAVARTATNPNEAVQLALAAAERDPGLASNRVLLDAIESQYELATLSAGDLQVAFVDISARGGHVATASFDGTTRIWDAHRAELLAELRGHSERVWCVHFDPSGERVVTASRDGTARIWRWREPDAVPLVLTGHAGELEWAEFSADGRRVVSASRDHEARLWDADDGRLLARLTGHAGNVSAARFCGTRYVLTFSGEPLAGAAAPESDSSARIFDAESGAQLGVLSGHTAALRSVAISPDQRLAVTTSDDSTARLWELDPLERGEAPRERHVFRLPGYVAAAHFHPDGRRLALSYDAGARVVDVESGALVYELADHDHRAVIDVAFDPQGRTLATAAFDNTVRLFDAADGHPIAICKGVPVRPRGLRWEPDGRWLVSWHTHAAVKVWYGPWRPFLSVVTPRAGPLASARYDPRGEQVLIAAADGRARLFEARSGEMRRMLDPGPELAARPALVGADFDGAGSQVVTTDALGTLTILDVASGGILLRREGTSAAPPAGFDAASGRVLFVGPSGAPELVDPASGASAVLRGQTGKIVSLTSARGSDGETRVACGTDARTVHCWILPAGETRSAVPVAWTFGPYETDNHKLTSVFNVCFSPDGRRLAATTQHQRTVVFESATGVEVARSVMATVGVVAFAGHGERLFTAGKWTGSVRLSSVPEHPQAEELGQIRLRDFPAWARSASYRCVAVAPSSRFVVAGSLDRTAKLWDLESLSCTSVYSGHTDAVVDIDFAPDGASFVTASLDGTARFWPIDLVQAGRGSLPRGGSIPSELSVPTPRRR